MLNNMMNFLSSATLPVTAPVAIGSSLLTCDRTFQLATCQLLPTRRRCLPRAERLPVRAIANLAADEGAQELREVTVSNRCPELLVAEPSAPTT